MFSPSSSETPAAFISDIEILLFTTRLLFLSSCSFSSSPPLLFLLFRCSLVFCLSLLSCLVCSVLILSLFLALLPQSFPQLSFPSESSPKETSFFQLKVHCLFFLLLPWSRFLPSPFNFCLPGGREGRTEGRKERTTTRCRRTSSWNSIRSGLDAAWTMRSESKQHTTPPEEKEKRTTSFSRSTLALSLRV